MVKKGLMHDFLDQKESAPPVIQVHFINEFFGAMGLVVRGVQLNMRMFRMSSFRTYRRRELRLNNWHTLPNSKEQLTLS
jgi:hypothetical protein